jgi:hypothetical protein
MSKHDPRKSFIQYELPQETLEKIQGGKGKLTTLAIGEEGCGPVTTKALGEEGGPIFTTLALGEEGGSYS